MDAKNDAGSCRCQVSSTTKKGCKYDGTKFEKGFKLLAQREKIFRRTRRYDSNRSTTNNVPKVPCDICGKLFSWRSSYLNHIQYYHPKDYRASGLEVAALKSFLEKHGKEPPGIGNGICNIELDEELARALGVAGGGGGGVGVGGNDENNAINQPTVSSTTNSNMITCKNNTYTLCYRSFWDGEKTIFLPQYRLSHNAETMEASKQNHYRRFRNLMEGAAANNNQQPAALEASHASIGYGGIAGGVGGGGGGVGGGDFSVQPMPGASLGSSLMPNTPENNPHFPFNPYYMYPNMVYPNQQN